MLTDLITPLSNLTGLDAAAVAGVLTSLAGFLAWFIARLGLHLWCRTPTPTPLSDWAALILQRLENQGGWSLTGGGSAVFRDDVLRVQFLESGPVFEVDVNHRKLLEGDLTARELKLIEAAAVPHRARLGAAAEVARQAAVTEALTRPPAAK